VGLLKGSAKLLAAIPLLLLVTLTAGAQTTGQIEGVVNDDQGAPLPGVTVEATSPALQGTKVAASDTGGSFRLVFLPPGSYTVRCSLSGFSPVGQAGIVVPLGRTATLQVRMQPAFHEEVTVTSATPLLDVRAAEVGGNVTRDAFLALPFDRNFIAVAQSTPGTTTDRSGTVVYGSTGLENGYVIDGVRTTDVMYGFSGKVLNFEFIQEVQVKTGGYAAEYGRSTGGVVNVITRSGGNEFSGDVFGYYFSDALQSSPKAEVETYRREYGGAYTVDAFREADLGFDLGGYLLKDKLWFFAAYDRVANDEDRRVAKDFTGYGGPPEGAVYVAEELRHLWSGKLTWRPGASHSLIASAFGDPDRVEGPVKNLNGTESTFLGWREAGGETAMLRWEGVLGSSVVVDAQVARFRADSGLGGPGTSEPLFQDFTTPMYAATGVPFRSGGLGGYYDQEDVRDTGRVDAALFVGDLLGDHELKAGAEAERARISRNFYFSGGHELFRRCAVGYLTPDGCPAEWAFYGHGLLLSGVPPGGVDDPEFASYLTDVQTQTPRSENPAAYLQDAWRVLPSLSLNLGVRWERQNFYDFHGTLKLALDDAWAPRIGFTWDVRNDGTTKVYGSWGRFYETAPLMLSFTFNDNVSADIYNRDPDSLTCDPTLAGEPWYGPCQVYSASPTPVDPAGVKPGYIDEALLGVEFMATPSLALGAKLVYRNLSRIVEDSAGPDGFYMGNPGYGLLQTAPDLLTYSWFLPVPPPKRTFKGIELTAVRRLADNWQLIASYLWSKLEGNYDGSYYPDYNQAMPNTSAAYDYADFSVHNDGYLSNDRRNQAKVSASYVFPFGLTTGVLAYYRSGTPVSALGSSWYGNILYLSQRGTWGRTDDEYEMNLHLSYPFKLGGTELTVLLDVFNLLDRQGETGRDQAYNLDWTLFVIDPDTGEEVPPIAPGTPCASAVPPEHAYSCNAGFNTANSWQDPRAVRVGLRLTF
jgi:hypothetical protein